MSVFPSSQATIDLQVLPTFPANVVATGAVDISKSGLTYTFGLNFQNVIEETSVSDLGKRELLAQDTDTGAFWRIKLSNLPTGQTDWANIQNKPTEFPPSSHTHPVSQISDATPLGQALVTAPDGATAQAALDVPPNARTISAGTGLTGGGDLSADRTLALASVGSNQILANLTGSTAAPTGNSLSAILDTLTNVQGSIAYRGASGWTALAPGPVGQVLTSGGAGADPSWQTAIGADALGGFRNKIINGNFDIWQRGTSQTSSGYGSDDRWFNGHSGYTKTHSRQSFTLGQTDVPGNPTYFSRTEITVAGSASSNYCSKRQSIESVRTLAGKTVTVTFWAKSDSNRNIAVELVQNFGTGGTPSSEVTGIGVTTCALTPSWQKFSFTASLPSISGKRLGSDGNDALILQFWFGAGSNHNARTNSLGHQTGTFDIARVSLVEGDATAEYDPFSPRHIQQELALCQRYYVAIAGAGTNQFGNGFCRSATEFRTLITLPVPMRTTPTVTISNAGDFQVHAGNLTATPSAISPAARIDAVQLTCTVTAVTAGDGGQIASTGGTITADAEL